eukprot:scaffold864_cov36-Cyclotella_meneghiniana.AAC.3
MVLFMVFMREKIDLFLFIVVIVIAWLHDPAPVHHPPPDDSLHSNGRNLQGSGIWRDMLIYADFAATPRITTAQSSRGT